MDLEFEKKVNEIHQALLGTLEKPGGLFARVGELVAKVEDLKERFIIHENDTKRRLDALEQVEGTKAKRYVELVAAIVLSTLVNQALALFSKTPPTH